MTPLKKQVKSDESSSPTSKVHDPLCVRTLFEREELRESSEFVSPASSSGLSEARFLPETTTNDPTDSIVITGTGSQTGRSFTFRIPERVVNFLEYDCYMVTMKNKVHKLPQRPSVAKILQDYLVWFVGNHAFKKKPDTYTMNTGEVFEVFDPLTSIRYA